MKQALGLFLFTIVSLALWGLIIKACQYTFNLSGVTAFIISSIMILVCVTGYGITRK